MSDFVEIGQDTRPAKDLKIILLEALEIVAAFAVAALLLRQFVLQPFSMPGNAMQATLLPGDRFFANKFIYGLEIPFVRKKVLRFKSPLPGEVAVFRSPRERGAYSIKRCVAGPGMEVEIVDKQLYLNGILFEFPKTAAPVGNFTIEAALSPRDNLESVRVPQKGERVSIDSLRLFEFDFFLSLIRQENPGAALSQTADLYLNGKLKNDIRLEDFLSDKRREDSTLNFDAMDWLELKNVLNFLEARGDSGEYRFVRTLYMDGKRLSDYKVRDKCFFFMGDNWEQSLDSRYYGYVAASSVVGRASCIYWSWHKGGPRFGRLFLFI